jgi:hypothetical protein
MNMLRFDPYAGQAYTPTTAASPAPSNYGSSFWGAPAGGYNAPGVSKGYDWNTAFSYNPSSHWGNTYGTPVFAPAPTPETSVIINQYGKNNKAQGQGANQDVILTQDDTKGGTVSTNTTQFTDMKGDVDITTIGKNNTIDINGVNGTANINATTQGEGMNGNIVHTDNTQQGVYFMGRGNTYLHADDSPFVDAEIAGNDGKSDNYRILIEDTHGERNNDIFIEADKLDNVTVDVSQANNISDIRIRGDVNKLNIRALNGQADIIRINEGLTLDLTNFDAFDTVVITDDKGQRKITTAGELREKAGLPKEGASEAPAPYGGTSSKAAPAPAPAPYAKPAPVETPKSNFWGSYAPVASSLPSSYNVDDWMNSFWNS